MTKIERLSNDIHMSIDEWCGAVGPDKARKHCGALSGANFRADHFINFLTAGLKFTTNVELSHNNNIQLLNKMLKLSRLTE